MNRSWIIFALGSAFFAGLTALLGKMGVENINSNLATFIRTIVILLVSALIISANSQWQKIDTLSTKTLLFLILSGIATGFSWLCYYRALQLGHVAQVASVDKLSVVFSIILAAIVLGESLTWQSILGCLLIVSGTVVIAWSKI